MSEEDAQETETSEEAPPSKPSEFEKLQRQNQELLSEVKAFRAERRTDLIRQYPALSEEMVKGLPFNQVKQIAEALSKAPQTPQAGTEQPPPTDTPPEGHAPSEATRAAQQFMANSPAGNPATLQKRPFREVKAEMDGGKIDWVQVKAMGERGEIDWNDV